MAEAICLEPLTMETVFDPGLVHLKFVVQKMALGQSFSRAVLLSNVTLMAQMPCTRFNLNNIFTSHHQTLKQSHVLWDSGGGGTGQKITLIFLF